MAKKIFCVVACGYLHTKKLYPGVGTVGAAMLPQVKRPHSQPGFVQIPLRQIGSTDLDILRKRAHDHIDKIFNEAEKIDLYTLGDLPWTIKEPADTK